MQTSKRRQESVVRASGFRRPHRFIGAVALSFGAIGAVQAQAPVTRGISQNQALEQRVDRLERRLENQNLVDLFMKVQDMQQDMDKLRGRIDVLNHELEGLKKRQRDLYLDIDRRMQQLESAVKEAMSQSRAPAPPGPPSGAGVEGTVPGGASGTGPAPGDSGAAGAGTTGAPSLPVGQESDAYEKAFSFLKDGRYQQAIQAFQVFLKQYPQGNFADNAQYWLGEARYVTRDYMGAAEEFTKVLEQYPNSSKAADAQLKVGFSYYELGQLQQAQKALQKTIDQYPDSTAARLAQKRLQQMKLEGHL